MKTILLSLLLAVAASAPAFAQTVPSGMTYQGRLTDASNAPVPDGTGYEIEVRLWSAPTGGTLLWGTRYTGVPLKSGAFNLILGSGGTSIPGAATTDIKAAFNIPNTNGIHLGLTTTKTATGAAIPSPTEILPRQQIFSTPYAFKAATVEPNAVDSTVIKDQSIVLADLSAKVAEALTPIGSVLSYVGTTAPQGWLICDGSPVSRQQYPALFVIMGTSHGSGDGSTTFNLPDYRGRFLRGVDGPDGSNADRDPDSSTRLASNPGGNAIGVGSVQNDQFMFHSHLTVSSITAISGAEGDLDSPVESISWYRANGSGGIGHPDHGYELGSRTEEPDVGKTSQSGGTETRPKNSAVNFIIKY